MVIRSKGIRQAALANVLWGTTFLAIHRVAGVWGSVTSSAMRFIIAAAALAVGLKLSRYPILLPRDHRAWGWIIATAVLGFGLLYPLQANGLSMITTGMSSAIMLTAPLLLVGLSAVTGGRVSKAKWLGVALGTVGGAGLLLARQAPSGPLAATDASTTGIAMTLGASLCLAASSLTTKQALASLNQGNVTFWSMLLGAVMLTPFALYEHRPAGTADLIDWSCLLYLSLVCSVIAFFLWNRALATGDAVAIASTMHIKTPVAIALGCLLNGERLVWGLVVGSGLVAIGVWVANRPSADLPKQEANIEEKAA